MLFLFLSCGFLFYKALATTASDTSSSPASSSAMRPQHCSSQASMPLRPDSPRDFSSPTLEQRDLLDFARGSAAQHSVERAISSVEPFFPLAPSPEPSRAASLPLFFEPSRAFEFCDPQSHNAEVDSVCEDLPFPSILVGDHHSKVADNYHHSIFPGVFPKHHHSISGDFFTTSGCSNLSSPICPSSFPSPTLLPGFIR